MNTERKNRKGKNRDETKEEKSSATILQFSLIQIVNLENQR